MSNNIVSFQNALTNPDTAFTNSNTAFRSELISILIQWAYDETQTQRKAVDVINELEFSHVHETPPAVIEYNVVRVIPVVNQYLKENQQDMRVAPINSSGGIEIVRLTGVDQ